MSNESPEQSFITLALDIQGDYIREVASSYLQRYPNHPKRLSVR